MPPSAPSAPRPRRVLIVLDDALMAELLVEALVDGGHHAHVAADEAALAAALATGRYDAAIVDLDPHARDGWQPVAALQQTSPAPLVIALLPCGAGDTSAPGCQVALEKPARLAALLHAVAAAPALANC
jgi:DNA-binding response OmpR family regulator